MYFMRQIGYGRIVEFDIKQSAATATSSKATIAEQNFWCRFLEEKAQKTSKMKFDNHNLICMASAKAWGCRDLTYSSNVKIKWRL